MSMHDLIPSPEARTPVQQNFEADFGAPDWEECKSPDLSFDCREALELKLCMLRDTVKRKYPDFRHTYLKIQGWELFLLNYLVNAASSDTPRRIVTGLLLENVQYKTGHLSLARAKQGLIRIASLTDFDVLVRELHSDDFEVASLAAHLLGWTKRDGAILPLMHAFSKRRELRRIIGFVLQTHFGGRIERYINRYMKRNKDQFESILNCCRNPI